MPRVTFRSLAMPAAGARKRAKPGSDLTKLELLRRERESLAKSRAERFGGPRRPGLEGPTFLEQSSVLPATQKDYDLRFRAFQAFCQEYQLIVSTSAELDMALSEWFDVLFFEGWGADVGTKGLAAVRFFMPILGQVGAVLPRAQRALRGWIKGLLAEFGPRFLGSQSC